MIDSPVYFQDIESECGNKIQVLDRFEICQGGPHIGTLYIDGEGISPDQYFGGPILSRGDKVYLTRRVRKFFFNGFCLCEISIRERSWKDMEAKGQIIWPKRIESNVIYYAESMGDEAEEKKVEVSKLEKK